MLRTLAEKAAQVAYSATIWTAAFAWMAGIAATWGFTQLIRVPHRISHPYLAGPGMAFCLRITGSKVEIIYDPDFDPERRSMFCQNHVNLMDAHAACASIPHAFCGLMNAWQFNIPFYGWIMSLAKGIPVGKGANRFREVAAHARDRAARGLSILVFPEAHRTTDGKVHDFKKGVFMMARDAGLPVVPLATHGMYELNRKGTWLFKPAKITIYVGAQIETAGLSNDELRAVIERCNKVVRDFADHGIMPGQTGAADEPSGELVA